MRRQAITALAWGTLVPHTFVSAFFRMPCDNVLTTERLDPIVNPGVVSGHVHNVAGGSNFGPNSDYASMRQSTCTSCPIKEDLSAYWTPQLYYRYENGSVTSVPNGGTTVYYLQRTGSANEKLHAFPEGFRMVSGNPFLRTYDGNSRAQKAINFACLNFASGTTFSDSFPNKDCPDGLRLQVAFPSCWDGKNLDSADHKSHMSFPTSITSGECDDPNYPVRLITLFYEVFYSVSVFKSMWYSSSTPFVLANGDPTGYGFHGDFLNGWNVPVLQNAIDTCLNLSGNLEDCKAFTIAHPASSAQQCHKSPSVDEVVTGVVLPALPGCNPVSSTAPSGPASCPNDVLSTLWMNAVGYRGTVAPDGTSTLAGTPSVLKSYDNWSYIGCYQDSNTRVFDTRTTASDMTVEKCIDNCKERSFKYAGLEWGQECWCGNTLQAPTLDVQSCAKPCAGNALELCGSGLTLLVYSVSAATTGNKPSTTLTRVASRPSPPVLRRRPVFTKPV